MVAIRQDEHDTITRRCARRFEKCDKPIPAQYVLSKEEASYLADEYGARQEQVEEVPRWYLVFMVACALAFVAVMSVLVLVKWWNREAGS